MPLLHKDGMIDISWEQDSEGQWVYRLETDHPIQIKLSNRRIPKELALDSVNSLLEYRRDKSFKVLREMKIVYS